MRIPTISTVTVRACDLPEGATVNVDGRWCYLYDVTLGGKPHPHDDEDITRISTTELDERYVILRVAKDPALVIRPVGEPGKARQRAVDLSRGTRQRGNDLLEAKGIEPGVYDDRLIVVGAHDPYDVQVVTYRDVSLYQVIADRDVAEEGRPAKAS